MANTPLEARARMLGFEYEMFLTGSCIEDWVDW
jgi:hypothetical protein